MQTKNLLVVSGFIAALSLAMVVVGSIVPAFATYAFRVEKNGCVMGDTRGNPMSTSECKSSTTSAHRHQNWHYHLQVYCHCSKRYWKGVDFQLRQYRWR